ncbi:tailless [Tribolium castaneum]|uniref:Tailless ortholog n=1 Tax=Tribolium castaneum TaxID=7070 RepID=Q9NCL0_TRICA|nr:tailless [Tribolium castaneum]AAF71999.1 tailless ortholog [Tribolium castaneum]|eukprot:NP_001034502.1 tailless [Tribolium castaneum]
MSEMQSVEGAMVHHLEPHRMQIKPQSPSSSSRILDIPCKVCGDFSSGKHYNIFACDGCAGFFKRSIRRNRQYVCKAKDEGSCIIDKTHRNQCRACRLKKCQNVGMNKDAVQHERGPRNSTLRRQQMSSYYNESRVMMSPPGNVLNLTMPKYEPNPSIIDPGPALPPTGFLCNNYPPLPQVPPLPLPPIFPPTMINPSAICESAAQLIFMNVQWVRSIPAFTCLPLSDQLLLLEESWLDLFVLGAAQFLPLMDFSVLVEACGVLQQEPHRRDAFLKEVADFQETLKKISQFQLDAHEFACLRAIVLFKTSFEKPSSSSNQEKTTTESAKISVIQDDAQMRLNKHVTTTYPKQPLRFGKILLLVSSTFRTISGRTIEDLFFKKVIRDTPIVAIISNMYKNQILGNNNV